MFSGLGFLGGLGIFASYGRLRIVLCVMHITVDTKTPVGSQFTSFIFITGEDAAGKTFQAHICHRPGAASSAIEDLADLIMGKGVSYTKLPLIGHRAVGRWLSRRWLRKRLNKALS
jgi:hypothetical protein